MTPRLASAVALCIGLVAASAQAAEPDRTRRIPALGSVAVGGDAPGLALWDLADPTGQRLMTWDGQVDAAGRPQPCVAVLLTLDDAAGAEVALEGARQARLVLPASVSVLLILVGDPPAQAKRELDRRGLGTLPAASDRFAVFAKRAGVVSPHAAVLPKAFLVDAKRKLTVIYEHLAADFPAAVAADAARLASSAK